MTENRPPGDTLQEQAREVMWRTTTGRANIIIKLWAKTDNYTGRTSGGATELPRGGRTGSRPPVSLGPPSRRNPSAYHAHKIETARKSGDLHGLRIVVEAAEHDLVQYLGLIRSFDPDDPYWTDAVVDSSGVHAGKVAVQLGVSERFVRQVRVLREEDPDTGKPKDYGELERRAIALKAGGLSIRRIADEVKAPRATVDDFLAGQRGTVRRTD